MVSARGEGKGGNKTDGGKPFGFTARQITGEAARLTTAVPRSAAGQPFAPSPVCVLVTACNVGPHWAAFSP